MTTSLTTSRVAAAEALQAFQAAYESDGSVMDAWAARLADVLAAMAKASGPELAGGAYISASDHLLVLGALRTAARFSGLDDAIAYRALGIRLGDDV